MLEKIKFGFVGVGTFLNYLLGGFDDCLIFLIIAMVIDFLCGLMKGYKNKELSSEIGYIGITKKVMILFILIIAVQLDRITNIGTPLFRTMVCWFFIGNECISILENASALGIPIPPKLKEALLQLKDGGKENGEV